MSLDAPVTDFTVRLPRELGQRTEILVDGVDVSSKVQALRIDAAQGNRLPVLTLYGEAVGEISGPGIVQVAASGADVAGAVRDFLAAIDPQQLEQAAQVRIDYEDGEPHGLTAAMLAQLRDWAGRG